MSSPKKIFIAAGGTGGHVFPAKRVAQKFIKEGFKVIWIGTNRGPEKNICKELDISYDNDEAHSAAYDAEVTAQVFCKIINDYDSFIKN